MKTLAREKLDAQTAGKLLTLIVFDARGDMLPVMWTPEEVRSVYMRFLSNQQYVESVSANTAMWTEVARGDQGYGEFRAALEVVREQGFDLAVPPQFADRTN